MPGGIKELVADVEVKTTDIGSEQVTDAKLGLNVGRWASGSFISGTTTWTGTAAFTVLMAVIKVTAAAAGLVAVGTTADSDAVMQGITFGSVERHCSICGEKQYHTPSGWTCNKGHGGADPKEDIIDHMAPPPGNIGNI